MSDSLITLANLVTLNDKNAYDLGATDLFNDARLIGSLAAQAASNGTNHTYLKESGAPTVGFRAVNVGRDLSKSADEAVTINLKYLDASFRVDVALANAFNKGPGALIARELQRHLKQAFFVAEQQLIYGTGNDADGYTGLANASTIDDLADGMVVNAGGSGGGSTFTSVFLLRTTPDFTEVAMIGGNDVRFDVGETMTQEVIDGNGKKFHAYCTSVGGWLGMQIGGAYSIGRICNIDTSTTSNNLTDDLLYEAISRYPESRQPTHIVMNRVALKQLRKSRTATNPTGNPAPRPVDLDGIPIVTTAAIRNDETALA